MIITIKNQQIKNIIKLMKSSKERREQGLFVVEGVRICKEIPSSLHPIFYVSEDYYETRKEEVLEILKEEEYELLSKDVFDKIADTKTPQGILAVVKQPEYSLEAIEHQQNPMLMVLENLQDPGNLGTILRSCEAAGVSGVILSKDTVDLFNPKVVRSTMGSIFRVPFILNQDMKELLPWLKEHHFTTYAAHLEGKDIYEEDLLKPIAFFIGNEGNGLSDDTAKAADKKIKIPMSGSVESLNAAIAATILAYEGKRQRLMSKSL